MILFVSIGDTFIWPVTYLNLLICLWELPALFKRVLQEKEYFRIQKYLGHRYVWIRKKFFLAYSENLGNVRERKSEGYLMIGYDDIASVQYFGKNLKAYWKKKYPTMEAALADARKELYKNHAAM